MKSKYIRPAITTFSFKSEGLICASFNVNVDNSREGEEYFARENERGDWNIW